jgi:mannose-1-phosphate guanylyltransferase/mannose-6-phosphate isomerase
MPSDPHMYAVVLAGGSGQRFWPLSRELSPKQLLSMFGTESLIAQAIHRILPFAGSGSHVTIVTSERLFDELRNHLIAQPDDELHDVRYIQEPLARNTAPAIALAAATLVREDPDAIMVVLPSDHQLRDGQIWSDCVSAAAAAAAEGWIVTIGIAPTRPESGYGYIRAGEALPALAAGSVVPHVAAEFVEKPDHVHAERFVADGTHLWNAGIFVMKAARVLEELDAAGDEVAHIARVARSIAALPLEERNSEKARSMFGDLAHLSIDVAVMERSDRVAVIPAPLLWNDVGSLLALQDVADPDAAGNVRCGRGVDIDSRGTTVYSTDRLVATLGVDDLIVVDTSDATLVLPKSRVQDVRSVVDALSAMGAPEVTESRRSLRPWGSWTLLMKTERFRIKSIDVKPGSRMSLQSHRHRGEHWLVIAGHAIVERDTERMELGQNGSVYLPAGTVHRLENPGPEPLQVIEVAVGDYLGEDDVVRIEDDFGR